MWGYSSTASIVIRRIQGEKITVCIWMDWDTQQSSCRIDKAIAGIGGLTLLSRLGCVPIRPEVLW